MGNAMSSLWTALVGEPPGVPTTVLVPPLFKPDGVSQRSSAAKSGYVTTFRPGVLKQLMQDYTAPGGGVTGRLLLTPPGSPDVVVSAVVRSGPAAGSSQKSRGSSRLGSPSPLDACVSLRWQPVPMDSSNFAEVKASGVGVTARGSVWHCTSGLGAFASASSGGDTTLGVRLSGHTLGVGAALVASPSGGAQLSPAHFPVVAWAVARHGRFTVGLEKRPVEADPWSPSTRRTASLAAVPHYTPAPGSGAQSILVRAREHGVSAAVAFRSAPPGRAAAFNAILEVHRGGDLVVSFVQHMAVRRRVKNPFEDADVVGITNYIDLGLRLAAPLAKERAIATAGAPAFELAAAWQINKNWLAKLKLGSHSTEACLAVKSWWTPALTASVCASRRVGDAATRYGCTLAVDNIGRPRFERADPTEDAQVAAARRYLAVQSEKDAAKGVRPLVEEGVSRRARMVAGGVADAGVASRDAFASRL